MSPRIRSHVRPIIHGPMLTPSPVLKIHPRPALSAAVLSKIAYALCRYHFQPFPHAGHRIEREQQLSAPSRADRRGRSLLNRLYPSDGCMQPLLCQLFLSDGKAAILTFPFARLSVIKSVSSVHWLVGWHQVKRDRKRTAKTSTPTLVTACHDRVS